MISSIHQFSLRGFLRFQEVCTALGDVAVISLLDRSECLKDGRPDLQAHHSALPLSFEDSYEDDGAAPWPDEPSSLQHLRYAQEHGERVATLSDARQVVEFVYQLHALPQKLALAVHCHGGISRSTAVADWVSVRFLVPIALPLPGIPVPSYPPRPNSRVLRLLDKAWAQRRV